MTALDRHLRPLTDLGIVLCVHDGHLRYRGPVGSMTPTLRAELAAQRDEWAAWCHAADAALDRELEAEWARACDRAKPAHTRDLDRSRIGIPLRVGKAPPNRRPIPERDRRPWSQP